MTGLMLVLAVANLAMGVSSWGKSNKVSAVVSLVIGVVLGLMLAAGQVP